MTPIPTISLMLMKITFLFEWETLPLLYLINLLYCFSWMNLEWSKHNCIHFWSEVRSLSRTITQLYNENVDTLKSLWYPTPTNKHTNKQLLQEYLRNSHYDSFSYISFDVNHLGRWLKKRSQFFQCALIPTPWLK